MENLNQETSRNNSKDFWQAEVLGQIYDTNFAEMTEWIGEGSLQPSDKVRRGNLRWIEARKVPTLIPFFNAKEQGTEPPAIHTSVTTSSETPPENFTATENFVPGHTRQDQNPCHPERSFQPNEAHHDAIHDSQINGQNPCVLHPEYEAKFSCETCANVFCGQCPKSYGGNVKICPMCGAMLKKIGEVDRKKEREFQYSQAMSEGFGVSDIAKAFSHPFRFKSSFLFGGVMFMIFTLGQSAGMLGGLFMLLAALVCFMLTNMLNFGILTNTVENFSKGDLEADFMPKFEDFNLWDDVVHPFFLSIAVYITSFGPLVIVLIFSFVAAFNFAGNQLKNNQDQNVPNQTAEASNPYSVDEKRAADQSDEVKKLLEGVRQTANEKRQITENGLADQENSPQLSSQDKQVEDAEKSIQENQKRELESVVGKTEETKQREFKQLTEALLRRGAYLLIFILLAALWALFYFPAACAVAGYTRSFLATINPATGIDTIKTLGVDYLKILGMFVLILSTVSLIGGFLASILSAFTLPGMGNLPVKAISSWITFYFSIVFYCLIGFALYKNSNKFKFYRG